LSGPLGCLGVFEGAIGRGHFGWGQPASVKERAKCRWQGSWGASSGVFLALRPSTIPVPFYGGKEGDAARLGRRPLGGNGGAYSLLCVLTVVFHGA